MTKTFLRVICRMLVRPGMLFGVRRLPSVGRLTIGVRLLAAIVAFHAMLGRLPAEWERFETPDNGPNLGVWRITNDPTIRDWANYHNTQCWSPTGRYLCYTRYGYTVVRSRRAEQTEVHLYDFRKNEDRRIDAGQFPRWAHNHNWLFYVHEEVVEGPPRRLHAEVRWLDLDSGKRVKLCDDIDGLGQTDYQDRWLYGSRRFRGQQPEFRIHRIAIQENSQPESLPEVVGAQLLPSPGHPVFFTRRDHNDEPFNATRFWFDLEGKNRKIFAPTIQKCHMSWLGNGDYLLLGNGLIRGRRWDEPFPSNLHILASVRVGDVSPCGRSGRYACGDSNVADLRSGDGWFFIDPLSIICYPKSVADNSGIYDADPKGSPDGTKVGFVSNYDLKDAPVTHVREDTARKADVLKVVSTEGFPESGAIVVQREVIGYKRKTHDSFVGLTRGLYETAGVNLRQGRAVTSFEARCLTDEEWNRMPGPSHPMRKSIPDAHSPLIRQRQTDVYVVVVRKPDRPFLRKTAQTVELVPGEEHYETYGYHLQRDGQRVTDKPLRPGSGMMLDPGTYRAVAVEWSGLESEPNHTLELSQKLSLQVLADPPQDFSWTHDRWLVNAQEASAESARRAAKSVHEIVHRYDGVIHREWYEHGVLALRHDLGLEGDAIRHMSYADGKLASREYYNRDGARLSREVFDSDGFTNEWIRYAADGRDVHHWYYDRGTPVREVRGDTEYVKRGDRFGYFQDGKFIDTPRGSISQ